MAIARGEIYFVNLSPVLGREQAGARPVLVLSIDAINQLPLAIKEFACHKQSIGTDVQMRKRG